MHDSLTYRLLQKGWTTPNENIGSLDVINIYYIYKYRSLIRNLLSAYYDVVVIFTGL